MTDRLEKRSPATALFITLALLFCSIVAYGGLYFPSSNASSSTPFAYAETILATVNPDGSATNYYGFVSANSSITGSSGNVSLEGLAPDLVAGLIVSQAGSPTFLPQSIQWSISSILSLAPPTMIILLYSSSCTTTSSSQGNADSKTFADAFGLNPQFLLSTSLSGSSLGLTNFQTVCLEVYQSSDNLDTMAGILEAHTNPSMQTGGLIDIFDSDLSSSFLLANTSSTTGVTSAAVFAGFVNGQFLAELPFVGNALGNAVTDVPSELAVTGGLATQEGVLHSSSDTHSISFASLTDYYMPVTFAASSTLSVAGIGVPLENATPATMGSASNYNFTIATNNPDLVKQSLGNGGDFVTVTDVSSGETVQPGILSTSLVREFPANLVVTKSFVPQADGTVLISIKLFNNDTDQISNITINDLNFTNAYTGALLVSSGSPLSSTFVSLALQSEQLFNYTVILSGIGTYVSSLLTDSATQVTYTINNTQFETYSNPVAYTVSSPSVVQVLSVLPTFVGSVMNQHLPVDGQGLNIMLAFLLVIVALEGYMEYRSLTEWRKI